MTPAVTSNAAPTDVLAGTVTATLVTFRSAASATVTEPLPLPVLLAGLVSVKCSAGNTSAAAASKTWLPLVLQVTENAAAAFAPDSGIATPVTVCGFVELVLHPAGGVSVIVTSTVAGSGPPFVSVAPTSRLNGVPTTGA